VPFSSSHPNIAGVSSQYNMTVGADLGHLADVAFVGFLHCKLTVFPSFLILWKEATRSYLLKDRVATNFIFHSA
jgi:hypothetical protein